MACTVVLVVGSDRAFFGMPGALEHAMIVGHWKGAKEPTACTNKLGAVAVM